MTLEHATGLLDRAVAVWWLVAVPGQPIAEFAVDREDLAGWAVRERVVTRFDVDRLFGL